MMMGRTYPTAWGCCNGGGSWRGRSLWGGRSWRRREDGGDGVNGFNTKERRRTKTHGENELLRATHWFARPAELVNRAPGPLWDSAPAPAMVPRAETACTARSAVGSSRGIEIASTRGNAKSARDLDSPLDPYAGLSAGVQAVCGVTAFVRLRSSSCLRVEPVNSVPSDFTAPLAAAALLAQRLDRIDAARAAGGDVARDERRRRAAAPRPSQTSARRAEGSERTGSRTRRRASRPRPRPMAAPTAAITKPVRRTCARSARGLAPSASRIPISRRFAATVYDMTP